MLEITADEIKRKLELGESFHFIDLREEWEFEEENIGAVNIPLPTLPQKLDELKPFRDAEIIIHCKTGMRGSQAQIYLKQKGFNKVINLRGGIEAYWELAPKEV